MVRAFCVFRMPDGIHGYGCGKRVRSVSARIHHGPDSPATGIPTDPVSWLRRQRSGRWRASTPNGHLRPSHFLALVPHAFNDGRALA